MSESPTATHDEPDSDSALDALVLEENPRLQAALEYIRLGLRVIPLHDRRKEPRLKKWTKKATTDASLVRNWFERWPGSNLGIVSGNGLVVLDVDPKNGGTESLAQLIATHGPMPPTPEARTGSGGTHYFFSVDQGIAVKNRTRYQPGLDIRGDGGYVVAPPSVHPSTGAEYEWVTHPDQGIAPIPSWLLSMITPPAKTAGGRPASNASKRKSKKKREKPTGGRQGSLKPVSQPRGRKGSGTLNTTPERQPRSFAGKGAMEADQDALLAEVIERFPVPGVGHRHNLMVRAVGSLAGRGIDDNTIVDVMLAWYDHFDAQGKVGSNREIMENELINCLRSTRNNPDFQPSYSEAFYESAYANYVLPQRVLSAIGATLEDLNKTSCGNGQPTELGSTPEARDQASDQDQPSETIINCIRVTRSGRMRKRLCDSKHERLFIECLLAVVAWKLDHQAESTLILTDMQLRRVVSKRFKVKMPVWDNKQIVRLKQKYVNRLGPNGERQPATVFELLRELRRGHRGKGEPKGSPSEYELTGIKILLRAGAGSRTGDHTDHLPPVAHSEQGTGPGVDTSQRARLANAMVAVGSCDHEEAVPSAHGDMHGPLPTGTLAALEGVVP